MKTLTIAELQERLSNAVLAALDNEVKTLLDHQDASGWTDKELPMLFRGLHPHIQPWPPGSTAVVSQARPSS